ncbi:MAG: cyclic nucleotide-binding domain-containing protein [bacterium]
MAPKNDQANKSIFGFQVGDALWGNLFKRDLNEQESILSTLKKVPLFKDMRKSELKEFDKIIHRRHFKAEETIFWEGEPGVGMYIVQDGLVAIYKNAAGEEREELAQLSRREFFGELALLDESPRSATAVALEDSRILGLFRPDLMELIERKPTLGNKFLLHLALLIGERLKRTNEELQAVWSKLDASQVIT